MTEESKQGTDTVISHNSKIFNIQWNYFDKFEAENDFIELVGCPIEEIASLPYKHYSLGSSLDLEKTKAELLQLSKNNSKRIDYSLSVGNTTLHLREFITRVIVDEEDYFSSYLVDISDIRKREHELLEIIEEKEKLNRSKDNLISIISHDLRAPFSSLLGFSEILLNEPNLSKEERTEYLQYIYDASDLQLKMVNHLLDWTRLQTGNIRFEPRRIDVKDIIDNCISVLTGTTIRKNIEVVNKANKGLPVNADERLISQVVTNLLSNAVKFTPSGKRITISTNLYKENMVEIIVADEGVGIDEKNQDKLFKIDSKFTEQGTDGEKGTGFGLTVAKEIVKKHNGEIWFYSELNKGSEFHFTLPKAENTILVIEEYEDLRDVYRNIVASKFNTYKINFVNNGFEALNLLTNTLPAILVLYHKMPMMSGLQLVHALREKDKNYNVKVILIADKLSNHEKNEYEKNKVYEFLPLDSNQDELSESFLRLLA